MLRERLFEALKTVGIDEELHHVPPGTSYEAEAILNALDLLDVEYSPDLRAVLPELKLTLHKVVIDELSEFSEPDLKRLQQRKDWSAKGGRARKKYKSKEITAWEDTGKDIMAGKFPPNSVSRLAYLIIRRLDLPYAAYESIRKHPKIKNLVNAL